MKLLRRIRYSFWRLLGGGLGRMARFCRRHQALNCGCFACYIALNHDRIVREAIEDAIRMDAGARPS